MSFSMFEIVLSIFVLMVSSVMIISIPWTTSVTVISLSMILVCMGFTFIIRFSLKKYTNRDFPPHEETNPDFSLEQPSMAVDEDQRSILASRKEYDVFISFRGEDTRSGFISHLRTALKNAGIDYFIDDDKLERGQEISQALLDAIDNSTFSVVIFSENYPTSSWCLDELAHSIQRREKNLQIVLPVFYKVDPSDVRKQKGSYADAFMIAKWKASLTTAANLSGWDLSKFKNEAELVSEIVNHIREKSRSTSSTCHLKDLVGIEKSIEDVKTLLSNSPMVGIYGMGGLGKTTLANVVFKQLGSNFDKYYFLENFREQLEKHGSTYVVKDFFKKLSGDDEENLDIVKKRLRHKKLLIVVDDVVDTLECHSLLEDHRAWLNYESKVILTSRDKQVLRNIIRNDDWLYSLQTLNREKALELFNLHAFKGKAVDQNYKELSEKFVDYAQGLPLALKVLGSLLFGKDKNVWQSMLSKLEEVNPDQRIVKVLRISFDGLDEIEQNMFLDIACFFRGKKNDVKDVLDACYGSSYDAVIAVLVDKCLITKSKDYFGEKSFIILEMHDLLQEMGQWIACGSDDHCLENYSRLWRREDINHVLENNRDTRKVKGIFLGGLGIEGEGEINLDPSVFEKMSSLKLLKLSIKHPQIQYAQFQPNQFQLPTELRYLEWDGYPSKSLGSKFTLSNLVHLSMPRSQLEKLWDGFQDLENLKYVDLSDSKKLICLPDLSRANLCHMDLRYCESLVELPPLKFHNIHDGILDLNGCHNLRIVSKMFGNIKSIDLSYTAIEELHSSIGSLKNLHDLNLSYCKHLKKLPSSSFYSESLQRVHMRGLSIKKFPELPKNIKQLDLSETSIRKINSSSFECTMLKSLPTTICKLKSLEKLSFNNCSKLKSFPEISEPMENLKELDLGGTLIDEVPQFIWKLKSLEVLSFRNCSQLKSFPEIPEPMENLKYLYLDGTLIEEVPQPIKYLPKLTILDLSKCKNLKSIPVSNIIYNMPNIFIVYIEKNHRVQDEADLLDVWISKTLQQSKCRCSCSNINIISSLKSYALCDYKFWKDFSCCECFLLYTIHKILMGKALQDRIFVTKKGQALYGPRVNFCYPGNKIPQWFAYKSMGFALPVDSAPSTWIGDESFLGIVICLVVDLGNFNDLTITCEIHCLTSLDKSHVFRSCLEITQKHTQCDTDRVFILYLTRDDIYKRKIASFKFNIKYYNRVPIQDAIGSQRVVYAEEFGTIKECGIRFIYKKDAEEFGTIHEEPHNGV